MNDHDIINVDNLSMNNFININDNQVKKLQDGNEDGDAVNIKQLNEFESNLVNLFRNEIKGVYFQTRNPVYNSYSAKLVVKTLKWSSITNYQWSGSGDFTLNSDSITVRQSGVYLLYYE